MNRSWRGATIHLPTMHCPFCARNLPDDAAFCYSCGARIDTVSPARGVAAGATLAGVGGPQAVGFAGAAAAASVAAGEAAALAGAEDLRPGPSGPAGWNRQTLMSPGGVPGFRLPAGPTPVTELPGGSEPTPLGPASAARLELPHGLRARREDSGPFAGAAAVAGEAGRMAAAPAAATPRPTHRSLAGVRDSILEERARARQRDADYGVSIDRVDRVAADDVAAAATAAVAAARGDHLYDSDGAEDSLATELVRRRDQQRNVVLVVAAAVVALGMALGGYLIGRAGHEDDRLRGAHDDGDGADDGDDLAAAPGDDLGAAKDDATGAPAAPTTTAEADGTGSAADGAAPRLGHVGADVTSAGHPAAPGVTHPRAGSPPPPGTAGVPIARTAAGSRAAPPGPATPAPAAPSATTAAPATAAPVSDLDTYARYGSGSDHDPGLTDSGIDEAGIAMVVRHHLPNIRACLERRLKINPTLSGRVEVQFTIGEDGAVPAAKVVKDTVGDPAVGDCIVGEMRDWRFPRPVDGAVNLIYPFVFPPRK
ncbi:MAG TPA: AgmX/PglI C-terminal domain-containing protein [Myxococcota bacterium]|nr:AgmX/PglI C-terminal domain-containing protein [Myxococcota bacterium]